MPNGPNTGGGNGSPGIGNCQPKEKKSSSRHNQKKEDEKYGSSSNNPKKNCPKASSYYTPSHDQASRCSKAP